MVKVITNRNPVFLKEAYACQEVDLQNHTGFIDPLEKYIEWDGSWVIKQMTAERVPRTIGRYPSLKTAMFFV